MTHAAQIELPTATSPQLLTRLVESISRGVRSTRGLAECLSIPISTVGAYLHAARWLGFVQTDGPPLLTPLGITYAFAPTKREHTFYDAVWSIPIARKTLENAKGHLRAEVAATEVMVAHNHLSPKEAHAYGEALVKLISPAMRRSVAKRPQEQLGLPLTDPSMQKLFGSLPESRLSEYDPDVYRFVLKALLDWGELSLPQLRALLDAAGGEDVALGDQVDLALQRGDAVRFEDQLVITTSAIQQQDLATSTPSLILSDLGYRRYLHACLSAHRGDGDARIARDQHIARYVKWDQRLFGHRFDPVTAHADLKRVLLERTLDSFPIATAGVSIDTEQAPFLDVWEQTALTVCLPPTLAQLQGGVALVNRMLQVRREKKTVSTPSIVDRLQRVHGGIFHPGEPMPRTVPDARSLRLRAVMNSPYICLATAILLLSRLRPDQVVWQGSTQGWELQCSGIVVGDPLKTIDAFCIHRGWNTSRRPKHPFKTEDLVAVMETLDLATVVHGRVILAERFYHQLTTEVEEGEVFGGLRPLADVLEQFLDEEPRSEE